jgi:hypothetical protein
MAAATATPPRLGQRRDPVGAVGEVVQGPQQQDGVDAGVGPVQLAGVADGGPGQRGGRLPGGGAQRLLHVPGQRVDQVDLVAAGRQGQGVDAGGAADVQHHRRRGRQVARQQLPGADPLQAEGPQPPLLGHAGVVGGDRRVQPLVVAHGPVSPALSR